MNPFSFNNSWFSEYVEEKFQENERLENYVNLIRELKKLRSMKLTVVPMIFGAHGPVSKNLE